MIDATTPELEAARINHPSAQRYKGRLIGAFYLPFKSMELLCVVHDGDEMEYFQQGIHGPRWEHVSVSVVSPGSRKPAGRVPTWGEMCFVKRTFWKAEETVLQFHPAESQYVNAHDLVLHLWRLVGVDHPLPPKELV
jgi:hypothetical protein